ncbi:unnamed protein product (macronuclear) [Paramecium tetraurelia]|uniref:Uncharacterized protein n=1 Tax=Paramecium tetraurelia TaxID=5888 RepID=A0CNN7_PARTE|nr:uncharacterized protein GSPATT00008846001 [Paramecium tetraurelia]CAK72404.1 unnamed protein product [Paramecium tetraurelia]|eukprot:XP_001439801.1 hypothetical protein (macronuclear) [Paramecium tetraurelia strain d4-2]
MNQASSSHSRNLYNYNGSAYSTDSMRVYSKSPKNAQQYNNRYQPCIYSTMSNIQNLQSLKNQISQLQSVLTQQHRKSSFTRSKADSSANISNDRSFYTMIKEQLKQVNNLQTLEKDQNNQNINQTTQQPKKDQVINNKKFEQDTEKQSKNITPQGSAVKNASILKDTTNNVIKSEKQQALRQLLYPVSETKGERNTRTNNTLEEQLRVRLQEKLTYLEQNKQDKMTKLVQEFKNSKKLLEEDYQNQVQNEIQIFERKLRKLMMSQNKDKKLKRLKKSSLLLNSKLNQESPCMVLFAII